MISAIMNGALEALPIPLYAKRLYRGFTTSQTNPLVFSELGIRHFYEESS
jgi:hypothetical protein